MRGSRSLLSQAELGASVRTEILLVLPLWGVSVLGFGAPEGGMRPLGLLLRKPPSPSPHGLAGPVVAVSGSV